IVILANLLMNVPLRMQDVSCTGITHITEKDIKTASKEKKRWKLIGVLDKTDNGCKARVQPELLPHNHPLYSVSGATNAITYTTELLGDVTLIGPGAGRVETGYALLEDLLGILKVQTGK
ncbi:MAG: homoserine dehydrogenase, partial [Chloroflexota bacterium]|nr:homoserine dehydrogenase [Chloroflexota bacterium]